MRDELGRVSSVAARVATSTEKPKNEGVVLVHAHVADVRALQVSFDSGERNARWCLRRIVCVLIHTRAWPVHAHVAEVRALQVRLSAVHARCSTCTALCVVMDVKARCRCTCA